MENYGVKEKKVVKLNVLTCKKVGRGCYVQGSEVDKHYYNNKGVKVRTQGRVSFVSLLA